MLLTLLLLLIPTALLAHNAAQDAPEASGDVPRFESADCPVDVPDEFASRVRCGVLTVPESRSENSDPTKTIRLPVAIIASASATPSPDPLIFPTTGGPGGTTLGALDHWLYDAEWALSERDIILMDQRGTEFAEPFLS
jgi:hypothetical protein